MFKYVLAICFVCTFSLVTKVTNLAMPYPTHGEESSVNKVLSRLDYYCTMLEKMAAPYVMQNQWKDPKKGIDCSGSMAFIFNNALNDVFKMSGIPFPRVTSREMANGAWPGARIKDKIKAWDLATFPTLDFWTYSAKRPQGHTALNREKEGEDKLVFAEASYGKKHFKRSNMFRGKDIWYNWNGILIPELDPEKWRLQK